MRITFNMQYNQGINSITSTQERLLKASAQLEKQTRILTPSDDPSGSARAISLEQNIQQTTQFQVNNQAVKNSLTLQETVLSNIKSAVQQARTLTLSLGNGSFDPDDREAVSSQLTAIRDQIFDLMNSRDELGGYLFSGYKDQTQPYEYNSATGKYEFRGDEGVKELQVGLSVTIPSNASGKEVFDGVDKRFTTTTPAVTAPVTAAQVDVSNQSLYDSFFRANYSGLPAADNSVRVALVPGAPDTYEVYVGGNATPAATGNYTAGQPVNFAGLEIELTGAVVGGEVTFDMAPPEKTNILDSLTELINQVNSGIDGKVLAAQVSDSIVELDNVSLKIGAAQSLVGGNINILDSIFGGNEDLQIATKSHKASIVEVDYVTAITAITKEETALQAVQATFTKITGLSLFDYIR
ncbi:flagellar hook-associated protein FlgL [Rheinheimera sp.]|uniref:flagellar hook-associated protein FlgL n=1 Tax=Rheinheimera sp. TaxID=1869214 RepID=UPI00307EE039